MEMLRKAALMPSLDMKWHWVSSWGMVIALSTFSILKGGRGVLMFRDKNDSGIVSAIQKNVSLRQHRVDLKMSSFKMYTRIKDI